MLNRKMTVVKVSLNKSKKGLVEENKKVLNTKDEYSLACHPFYKFIFDEIRNLRGENNNEKEQEN